MTCLGKITVDPCAKFFGYDSPFMRFVSPLGVNGLVQVRSPRLDILAVIASQPGTGQFRAFIAQAKTEFDTICIWECWNPLLPEILPRYGFQPATDFIDHQQLTGFRWDKPQ